jgi:hypothetical protein
VSSSAVDWRLPYDCPAIGEELTLDDLMSRIPDLFGEYRRSSRAVNYTQIHTMTYTEENGFTAKVRAEQFTSLKDSYARLGFNITQDGDSCDLKCDNQTFAHSIPQFMHAYVNKMFGSIPTIHLVKPFESGSRYSQLAITYMLSYCFGMLTRYFPTHWVSLLSGDKGDGLWPAINAGQKYIDSSFPELIIELIHDTLDQKNKAVA